MRESKLFEFYQNRFGSGLAVADHFKHEIAREAAQIGVDWLSVSSKVTWKGGQTGKVNAQGSSLLKGYTNSVGVYASIEHSNIDRRIEFPRITLKDKGGHGSTVNIDGFRMLL